MENKRKNKDFNPNNCPVTHFYNKVGGKWKTVIMYGISMNVNRFSMLQKAIPMISKQMLVNQLREMEEDQIIERIIYAEIPPRVEYKLTEYGKTFMPILMTIQDWGIKDMALKN
ncbi:helix-turn-helix domain-containing protein [Chryseobacterium culicis]|uniref:Transcriptional regulator, HxlR family n=1 Tax=Chryseobacterium culicis TaxID=680127 RepID=A0A1H6H1L2_CHRCI|nr:helix-turn-helix domain-containing protein [Chryseobacterium culicis]SEH28098.1 transcriptional regulator, HxlR family [Chryseobacterium culicis]